MSNELDLSAFDEDEAATALDLSAFEDAPVEIKEADPVGDATRGLMGAGAGALGGAALNKGLEVGVNAITNNLGALRPEDIAKIDQNRDLYKELKKSANPLEDMMEQFRVLGDKNRQGGIDSAAAAVESLRGKPNMPINEFYKTIASPAATNMDYSDALPENTKAKILGENLDAIAPDQRKDLSQLMSLEEEMGKPFQDERLSINQSIKDAKYENKLGQINVPENKKLPILDAAADNKAAQKLQELEQKLAQVSGKSSAPVVNAKEDFIFGVDNRIDRDKKLQDIDIKREKTPDFEKIAVKEEFADKRDGKKLERFDEKISATEQKIAAETRKIEDKKRAFQQQMADKKAQTGTLRDIDQNNAQARVQSRKDQLIFNKILDDEKSAQMKNLKQKEKMEKLLADKQKLEAKIQERVQEATKKTEEAFTAEHKTPKKILEVTPELQGRVLREGYADSLANGIKNTERLEELELPAVHKRLRELQEADTNYEQGGAVNNFRKEMANSLSTKLKEDEGYKKGMASAEESYKTDALWDKNGIRYDKKLDRTTLEDSGRSKLNQILLDGEKNKVSKEYLMEALQDAERQGHLPPGTNIAELMNRSEVAALQGEVGRLRQGGDLNAFDINSIAKGEYSRAPGITSKLGGTKLQELMGMYKNSIAGKGIQKLGKYGLPVAGALAGGMAAASAAESGELTPEAALLSGTAEAFNPTPFDMVEGAKGGAKGIDEALAQSSPEELTAEPTMGADDIGGASLVSQNPVVQKALSGFAEGAVTPLGEMAKSAAETFSEAGTARSNDARARMEQNFGNLNISKSAPVEKKSVPHEDFRNFVEQRPEQIQELAQFFSNDEKTASFVAPLEKAAQADDRTRSAVLFGLYQQPAFRQAMSKKGNRGM